MGRNKDQKFAAIVGGLVGVFAGSGSAIAIARGSTGATARVPTTGGNGAVGVNDGAGSDASTNGDPVRRRSTLLRAIVAVVALVVLVALMVLPFPADSVWAKGVAIIAGVLVLVKEIFSAFAREGGMVQIGQEEARGLGRARFLVRRRLRCVGSSRRHSLTNVGRSHYARAMKRPAPKPEGYERCGACGALVRVVVAEGVVRGFERHKVPSSHLQCENGTQPVMKPKRKPRRAHKGKSVRALGGGLPGLGKRN